MTDALQEVHLTDPTPTELTQLVGSAAVALMAHKLAHGSGKRIVTAKQVAALCGRIIAEPDGVAVVHGGVTAGVYPASTVTLAAGWYTRGDGKKCIRVIAGILPVKSAAFDPEAWFRMQYTTHGITFYSDSLRELVPYLDIPTGEAEYDAARLAVYNTPGDVSAWSALAKIMDEQGASREAQKVRRRSLGVS